MLRQPYTHGPIATTFGTSIREIREALQADDRRTFSLRQVAERAGIQPSYLSRIERDLEDPPGEAAIRRLAGELGEDADVLLALAGKVSTDLQEVIQRRPKLFGELIRELRHAPDHAVLRIVREVRDGDW